MIFAPDLRQVSPDWHVRAIVMGVASLAGLDLSMTAFAAIAAPDDLPVLALGMVWLVVATTVPMALLLLPWLLRAERTGRRRSIVQGLRGFLVGAVLAALVPGVWLTGARLLQSTLGLALAGSLALCNSGTDGVARTRRFVSLGAAWCMGLCLGPVLGHLLLQFAPWRVLFVVEAAVAAVLLVLAPRVLVESRATERPARGDLRTALLSATAVLLLCLGGESLVTDDVTLGEVTAVTLGLVCAGVAALRFQRRQRRLRRLPRGLGSWAPGTKSVSLLAAAGSGVAIGSTMLAALWSGAWIAGALMVSVVVVGLLAVRAPITRPLGRMWVGGLLWFVAAAACWSGEPVTSVEAALLVVQGVGLGIAVPALDILVTGSGDDPRGFVLRGTGVTATRLLGAAAGVLVGLAMVDAIAVGRVESLLTMAGLLMMLGFAARRRQDAPVTLEVSDERVEEAAHAGGRERGTIGTRAPAALLEFMRQREIDPLSSLPMFSGLSAEQIQLVRAGMDRVEVQSGATLYTRGETSDAVYLVSRGRFAVVVDEVRVRDVRRGEALGVSDVLTGVMRSETVVAARDSVVQCIPRSHLDHIADATFMRALSVSLAEQLREATARLAMFEHREVARDVVIAVVGVTPDCPVDEVLTALSDLLRKRGDRVITPGLVSDMGLERAEEVADRVVIGARADDDEQWREFCLRSSDRLVLVTTRPTPDGLPEQSRGSDIVIVDAQPSVSDWQSWDQDVAPNSRTRIEGGAFASALAPLADRILGRSLGIAFSGGGARALAHIGVIEVLEEHGVRIDRVAGTSLGAVMGAFLATGRSAAELDATAYKFMVKKSIMGDYTLPRTSLLRGARIDDSLAEIFGDLAIEALALPFACVSVDLVSRQQVVHRRGNLVQALAASSRLPGILPPYRHGDGGVHVDGGLVNNLPVDLITGPLGPVIAVQVGGLAGLNAEDVRVRSGSLGIPETIMRSMMMASDNANEAAIARASVLIRPDTSSANLTEFFQIDALREAGRAATLAVLPEILALARRA